MNADRQIKPTDMEDKLPCWWRLQDLPVHRAWTTECILVLTYNCKHAMTPN